jgi:lysophospholipase L1-like esterase
MKLFLIPRRLRLRAIAGWAAVILVAGGAGFATAQVAETNAVAPTPGSPASFEFPGKDLLPGKGPINAWKGFPRLWAERRSEFWQRREVDKGAVVFLGDSITQGWGTLAADFPELKVANRGIGGDVTRGVLYRLKEDVIDLEPRAVVLLIGINDLGNGGDPTNTAENIQMILSRLEQSNARMPIVVCKVMPSKKDLSPKIRHLNSLIDEMVRSDSHVIPCDTWSLFASEDGSCYKGEFPDLLHPNGVGYAKWAATLRPVVAGLKLAQGDAKAK